MPLYFMLHDAARFCEELVPALAASWRERSFHPCTHLCQSLEARVAEYTRGYQGSADEFLLTKVPAGLCFDRGAWRLLAAELLLIAADELPELQTLPTTLCALLAPDCLETDRPDRGLLAPIQQAHHGSRDLRFGDAIYRPEAAGLNDATDVNRLADYLASIRPDEWSSASLIALKELVTDEDREDELSLAREWFPSLRRLYQQAAANGQLVICEVL
jgi:hypothetical protein